MRHASVWLSVMLFCVLLGARPKIECRAPIYDFGTVAEDGGGVYGEFSIRNVGDVPLQITSVNASCGCTELLWPKAPVAPGMTAKIGVIFIPDDRPGPFMKQIDVGSNAGSLPMILTIRGTVKRSASFPRRIGALEVQAPAFSLGMISRGGNRSQSLRIRNTGDHPLELSFTGNPRYCRLSATPLRLAPGAEGRLTLQVDTAYCPRGRKFSDSVDLIVKSGGTNERGQLGILFELLEP